MLNFDFWDREWPVITGAPHIVAGGLFLLVVAIFLLVRWAYSREIAGLKAESGALNERLRLAHMLAPVYGWFTEGFDTRDLKDAKALLEELSS